ncbi:hypothetical protein V8C44DRAFT_183447 [Trichoderma aethiopicum]
MLPPTVRKAALPRRTDRLDNRERVDDNVDMAMARCSVSKNIEHVGFATLSPQLRNCPSIQEQQLFVPIPLPRPRHRRLASYLVHVFSMCERLSLASATQSTSIEFRLWGTQVKLVRPGTRVMHARLTLPPETLIARYLCMLFFMFLDP